MKKIVLGVLGVVLVLTAVALVAVYLSLGALVKAGVERIGPQATQSEVGVGKVTLSPLSGRVELRDVRVGNPEGFETDALFKLGLMRVRLEPRSLMSDTIRVQEIIIEGPEFTYEASLKGSNIGQLKKNVEAFAGGKAPAPAGAPGSAEVKAGSGKKVRIDRLRISAGKMNLSAKGLGGQGLVVPLPEIQMENLGGGKGLPEVLSEIATKVTQVVTDAARQSSGLSVEGREALEEKAKEARKALEQKAGEVLKGFKGLVPPR